MEAATEEAAFERYGEPVMESAWYPTDLWPWNDTHFSGWREGDSAFAINF